MPDSPTTEELIAGLTERMMDAMREKFVEVIRRSTSGTMVLRDHDDVPPTIAFGIQRGDVHDGLYEVAAAGAEAAASRLKALTAENERLGNALHLAETEWRTGIELREITLAENAALTSRLARVEGKDSIRLALLLTEIADLAHDECPECDGDGPPEACEICFQYADAARCARRDALGLPNVIGVLLDPEDGRSIDEITRILSGEQFESFALLVKASDVSLSDPEGT